MVKLVKYVVRQTTQHIIPRGAVKPISVGFMKEPKIGVFKLSSEAKEFIKKLKAKTNEDYRVSWE